VFYIFKENLPQSSVIIQADTETFWVIFELKKLHQDGKRIVDSLSNQIEIEHMQIYIDFSIGIVEAPDFKTCQTLIPFTNAERLAGYAKNSNLPYVIYDDDLLLKKYEFNLLGLFPKALENNHTYLVFQPVIDAQTGQTVSVESLIRWKDENYGIIMPNDFIPLVESTQLIHTMTDWVIKNAIKAYKSILKADYHLMISINLSSKNLNNPSFYKDVMRMTTDKEIMSNNIIFEVTETVLLEDNKKTKNNIKQINRAGYQIAIDDFGKGYSSLTYLSQFKTDFLKIDKEYIKSMLENESILQIVKATIALAHQFGLKVVAEGVETKAMYDSAVKLGIDYLQGFYIAKPMALDDLYAWLEKTN